MRVGSVTKKNLFRFDKQNKTGLRSLSGKAWDSRFNSSPNFFTVLSTNGTHLNLLDDIHSRDDLAENDVLVIQPEMVI